MLFEVLTCQSFYLLEKKPGRIFYIHDILKNSSHLKTHTQNTLQLDILVQTQHDTFTTNTYENSCRTNTTTFYDKPNKTTSYFLLGLFQEQMSLTISKSSRTLDGATVNQENNLGNKHYHWIRVAQGASVYQFTNSCMQQV